MRLNSSPKWQYVERNQRCRVSAPPLAWKVYPPQEGGRSSRIRNFIDSKHYYWLWERFSAAIYSLRLILIKEVSYKTFDDSAAPPGHFPRAQAQKKLKPLGNIFVHFMSGKWYRVILLFSAEFFYPVILSDLIGTATAIYLRPQRSGGVYPRP